MTRIFENLKEAVNEVERDIHEMGITAHPHTMQNKNVENDDNYTTKEIRNYSFAILDLSKKDKELDAINLEWCQEEFRERVMDENEFCNPGEAWNLRADVWTEFLDKNGQFEYTYNQRINQDGQLNRVIEELKVNPDSRQCIIMIHNPRDKVFMKKKRIPCSLSYQFMVRDGKLDIIYNMRSSDFNTHFRNDIWLADELRRYVGKAIDVPSGLLYLNIASLHVYKGYGQTKHVF